MPESILLHAVRMAPRLALCNARLAQPGCLRVHSLGAQSTALGPGGYRIACMQMSVWPRAQPWARLTQGCLHGPLQAALLEASWTNLLLLVQLLFITLLLRHKACYTIQLYPVAKLLLLLLLLHSDCFM